MENEMKEVGVEGMEPMAVIEPAKPSKKKYLKIILSAVVVAGIAVGAYFWQRSTIAATVDGSPISRSTIIQRAEKKDGKQLLDSFIVQKLINNEAKKNKIIIADADIAAEVSKIEDQIKTQGSTLEDALAQQGMTKEELNEEMKTKLEVERLLADKTVVTDTEVQKYITDNKIKITKGQEDATNAQIRDTIHQQKLSAAASPWLAQLKSAAKIKYYVNY